MSPRPPMAPSEVDPRVWLGGLAGVTGITDDSRRVRPGMAFALCGSVSEDRRAWVRDAEKKGAEALFFDPTEGELPSTRLATYPVPQLRSELSRIAGHFYGDPSASLQVFGVTGTNGKTSCSHWVAEAFRQLDEPCALIGTLGAGFLGALESTGYTTPGPIEVQSWLRTFKDRGAHHVAMEVSSHALTEARVDGVQFDVALFTNLTHDHLDYHGSIEAYAHAKSQLFFARGLKSAVLNIDDALGRELAERLASENLERVTYSAEGRPADYRAEDISYQDSGFQFVMCSPRGRQSIRTHLSGAFNVANVLGVSASLVAMGVDPDALPQILEALSAPAGRMETLLDDRGVRIVIDYAHTPDALQKVLQALRVGLQGRLIAVLGCGGDRDRAKRPLMGAVAEDSADLVILTSDNPRNEDPIAIMAAISGGMKTPPYGQMLDRATAIRQAILLAEKGDVVLIAGKGHEPYQEIQGVRHPFSDRAVVESLMGSGRGVQ